MININKFETTERPECNKDTKLFFDDVCTNSTRTKKAQVETAQCGRSMIEMLGVLAIVGVLSVGSIAGYSKAMFKYKMNKYALSYNTLLNDLLDIKNSLDIKAICFSCENEAFKGTGACKRNTQKGGFLWYHKECTSWAVAAAKFVSFLNTDLRESER